MLSSGIQLSSSTLAQLVGALVQRGRWDDAAGVLAHMSRCEHPTCEVQPANGCEGARALELGAVLGRREMLPRRASDTGFLAYDLNACNSPGLQLDRRQSCLLLRKRGCAKGGGHAGRATCAAAHAPSTPPSPETPSDKEPPPISHPGLHGTSVRPSTYSTYVLYVHTWGWQSTRT
eukprot:353470-Chlamydomonas_euryale.AAC.2